MTWFSGLIGRDGTSKVQVDSTQFGMSVVARPFPHTTFGFYRTAHRTVLANTQAANSRLFTIRNTGANIIIPMRLVLKWLQTGNHTAAIEDSLDVYKLTGFTVQDTTNTVTPTAVPMRVSGMAAAPGNVELRGVTVAGAAAGMTGGTLVKSGNSIGSIPKWLIATQSTTPTEWTSLDVLNDSVIVHPLVLANNEGLLVENRVLLGAAAASSVYIDLVYAELPALAAPLL